MINNFSVPVGGKRAQPDQPSKLQNTTAKKNKKTSSTKNTTLGQLLTAFPWLEKQCFGDGETSFSVCCKIWAAFPEKMPKSSSLGFKGFSGNIEVSNLNQARGRRRPRTCTDFFFHENYKRCSTNGRLYERDTPETHAPA